MSNRNTILFILFTKEEREVIAFCGKFFFHFSGHKHECPKYYPGCLQLQFSYTISIIWAKPGALETKKKETFELAMSAIVILYLFIIILYTYVLFYSSKIQPKLLII